MGSVCNCISVSQKPAALNKQDSSSFKKGESLSDARLENLKAIWDIDTRPLGQGAFGTVYKATSKSDPNQ